MRATAVPVGAIHAQLRACSLASNYFHMSRLAGALSRVGSTSSDYSLSLHGRHTGNGPVAKTVRQDTVHYVTIDCEHGTRAPAMGAFGDDRRIKKKKKSEGP